MPTATVDTSTSMMIAQLLQRTFAPGIATLLVTKDPECWPSPIGRSASRSVAAFHELDALAPSFLNEPIAPLNATNTAMIGASSGLSERVLVRSRMVSAEKLTTGSPLFSLLGTLRKVRRALLPLISRVLLGNLDGASMDFACECLDLFDDEVSFDVGLVIVSGEFTADLVLSFGGNQQDRALHRCQTRQDQIEEDEGVLVEANTPVADHPAGEKHKGTEDEAPRSHSIAKLVGCPLTACESLSCSYGWVVVPTRPVNLDRVSKFHKCGSSSVVRCSNSLGVTDNLTHCRSRRGSVGPSRVVSCRVVRLAARSLG